MTNSSNYEIERLEQDLKDTQSTQQRDYISDKLKELYATHESNGKNLPEV